MFTAYLKNALAEDLAFGTIRAAKSRFKNHIAKYYEDVNMVGLPQRIHRNFMSYLKAHNVGPATRNRVKSLIQVMFTVALEGEPFEDVFEYNPFRDMSSAKYQKPRMVSLTEEEFGQFLAANEGTHYYPMLLFMVKAGPRIGEVLGAHGFQFDLSIPEVVIDRQFDNSQRRLKRRTKSLSPRYVPLFTDVAEALAPLVKRYPNEAIFKKQDGSPIWPEFFARNILKKACRRAGVKSLHPHALRHSFAAYFLRIGGTVDELSRALGHASVDTTQKHYAHFDKDRTRRRMKVLEQEGNVVRIEAVG